MKRLIRFRRAIGRMPETGFLLQTLVEEQKLSQKPGFLVLMSGAIGRIPETGFLLQTIASGAKIIVETRFLVWSRQHVLR